LHCSPVNTLEEALVTTRRPAGYVTARTLASGFCRIQVEKFPAAGPDAPSCLTLVES